MMNRRDFLLAGVAAGALPVVKSAIESIPNIEVVRQIPAELRQDRTVLLQWPLFDHHFLMSQLRVDFVPRVAVLGVLTTARGAGNNAFPYEPLSTSWLQYDTAMGVVFNPGDVIEVAVRRPSIPVSFHHTNKRFPLLP